MTADASKNTPAAPDSAADAGGFGVAIPFAHMLGIRVIEQTRDKATLHVHLKPEFLNSWGVANGGVVMTMLDLCMGAAVRGHLGQALSVLTIDASMSFMNPARGDFTATGRVLRPGKSMMFCEAEAHDSEGTLLAKALGTMKAMLPKDGR